jgi:acyl-CoA synthetase (AMP-forming)/AMP-acid ligase II
MTFHELTRATEAVASGLEGRGLGPNDRVFLFVPMSPWLYVSLFGVLRLGAVAIFLDSWARKEQLALCADQVDPKGFIGPEIAHRLVAQEPAFAGVDVAVRVGPGNAGSVSLEELMTAGGRRPIEPVEPASSALVTFTTGSSGVPKGADRTHRFLTAQHAALDANIPYRPDDVDLPVFPVFSLNNLAAGVTTVLPNIDLAQPTEDDGERLVAQLEGLEVTCSTLSPWLLRAVTAVASEHEPLRRLRRVVTGGAPIGLKDVRAFETAFPDTELHILYGSTEVEPIAHLIASEMPAEEAGGVCLGDPSSELEIKFVDSHRGPIALGSQGWAPWERDPGEGGELLVSGAHVCPGYFRNPDAFARAKVVDSRGRVWHRTGDVCRLDRDGRLWMLGRVHNAVQRAGHLLFPVEPELLMKELPFVERAAYVGVPHPELGEAAYAVFTVADGRAEEDMERTVRGVLTDRGFPVDEVVATTHIPMDPRHHSKVDADALRTQLAEGRGGTA